MRAERKLTRLFSLQDLLLLASSLFIAGGVADLLRQNCSRITLASTASQATVVRRVVA